MTKVMSEADAIIRQVMLDFEATVEQLSVITDMHTETMESYRRGYLDALSIARYRLNNQEN